MILGNLRKSRKTKHADAVRDHIFYLHRKLTKETIDIDQLKGKPLNAKVKELQEITTSMKKYQRYLNIVLL